MRDTAWTTCGADSDKHSKTPERHWITHGRAKRDSTGRTGGSGVEVDRVAGQLTRLSASPVRARLRVGSPGASRKTERRLSSRSIPQPIPFGCVPAPVGLPSRSCQLGEVAERPVRLVPGYPGTAIAPCPCPHPCPRPRPCLRLRPCPRPCPHRGCESCSPSCRCGSSAAPGSSPSDQLSACCWCPDWS